MMASNRAAVSLPPSIARAIDGDQAAQATVVAYFSPYLVALAGRHRALCTRLGQEPEDLVQEVWAIFLTKIEAGTMNQPAPDRAVRALMSWLSTALGHVISNRRRKGRAKPIAADGGSASTPEDYWGRLPAATSGIVTKVLRHERRGELHEALQSLAERDREVVLLRGIGQVPNQDVATLLGLEPKAVVARYRRALTRLRRELPDSLFGVLHELENEDRTGSSS